MSKQLNRVVIVNENVIGSIVKDIVTFALFAGLMWFNHACLNGSTWIDLAFILFVFLWLLSKRSSQVYSGSKEGAIKWLGMSDE